MWFKPSVQRDDLSHPLQGCYLTFKSTANMNTAPGVSGKRGGGKRSVCKTSLFQNMLILWPWPQPEGCSGSISLSWPKWGALELIPFTGSKPFTLFLPRVFYNFGIMLSQVCEVLISLTPTGLLTMKTSCLTVFAYILTCKVRMISLPPPSGTIFCQTHHLLGHRDAFIPNSVFSGISSLWTSDLSLYTYLIT